MPNDDFQIVESAGQKAYVLFGKNPDAQLNILRNELAKTLLETYLRENKEIADDKPSDLCAKNKMIQQSS